MKVEQSTELKAFNRIYKELDETYHRIALNLNLSDSAFIILYDIAEIGENCRQKDIAERFSVSKQTINTSVRKMESQGLVELKAVNSRDIQIVLTPKGQKFIEEKIVPVIETEKSVFKEMGKKDSKELLRLTQKYVDIFKKKSSEIL